MSRVEIPTDSIKRKMLNVYVENGHCTGNKRVVLLVTELFDNVL